MIGVKKHIICIHISDVVVCLLDQVFGQYIFKNVCDEKCPYIKTKIIKKCVMNVGHWIVLLDHLSGHQKYKNVCVP